MHDTVYRVVYHRCRVAGAKKSGLKAICDLSILLKFLLLLLLNIVMHATLNISKTDVFGAPTPTYGAATVVTTTNRCDRRTLVVVSAVLNGGATSRHLRDAALEWNVSRLLCLRVDHARTNIHTASAS